MSNIIFAGDWVQLYVEEDTHLWYRVIEVEFDDMLSLHDGSTVYAEDISVKKVLSNTEFCELKGICPYWESFYEA